MLSAVVWWFALQLIGLVALPVTLKLLRFLPDRGFGFVRPLGLIITGYLFWMLVSAGILGNTVASIVVVLGLVAALSAWIWSHDGPQMTAFLRDKRSLVIVTEVVYLMAFACLALFRAYNPDISATEKPMEFGFINGILRSSAFPPHDPWLSGYGISYYYFGYVLVAMLTRLTSIPSDITFNLTVAMLFALTVTGAFSLVTNMVLAYGQHRCEIGAWARGVRERWAVVTGLLGALFVALMGNLEGIFELIRARGGGSEALWRWLDVKNLRSTPPSATWVPDDMWWWWRASRVIHDRDLAGNSIEVIDEFPFFSFLLGDNHPHVLGLPFVLLALALAFNVLLSVRHLPPAGAAAETASGTRETGLWRNAVRGMRTLWPGGLFDVLLWALVLGSLGFLNFWDFPVYLVVFALAYALRHWASGTRHFVTWLSDVLTVVVLVGVLGFLLYLPFYIGFRSQAGGFSGVGPVKTRLHQYLLMFGTYAFLIASMLGALLIQFARRAQDRGVPLLGIIAGGLFAGLAVVSIATGWWTAGVVSLLIGVTAFLLVWGIQPAGESTSTPERAMNMTRLELPTAFALALVLAGLGLTLVVEFLMVRDTFGTRMNTVFKFYYQAWVLLALASAYGVSYVISHWAAMRSIVGRVSLGGWGLVGTALVGVGLCYTVPAVISKAEFFRGAPTLDGTRYVEHYRKDDYDAIQWLRQNAAAGAVMLEAPGGSYSEYNWVSAHTGIPTLLGWGGHELQWRGNYQEAGRREPDIAAIYQGQDPAKVQTLLDKYGIDYVYVGRLERDKYRLTQAQIRKFDRILMRAYESPDVTIFARSH